MQAKFYVHPTLHQRPVFWSALIAVLVALLVGIGLPPSQSPRRPVIDTLGPTQPFRAPAFLNEQTIIWQPSTANTPLVAQSLTTHTTTGILPYSDVVPERWLAVPAEDDAYHIVWLERDDRLRSALIDANGETKRGPITLAFRAGSDFATATLPDQSVVVVWRKLETQQITAQIIDPLGRPDVSSITTLAHAGRFATTADRAGTIHFAWIEATLSTQQAIYYQAVTRDHLAPESPIPVHTLSLAPTENITSLQLGLDQTHVYMIWSVTTAASPDHERVFTLVFPLDQPENPQIGEVRLPQQSDSYKSITAGSLRLDRVHPLATEFDQMAALRWPILASGQNSILPLAITYRTSDGWRPGVVYYQQGTPLGQQSVANRPANSSPPAITIRPDGKIVAAWSGLNGTTPILYIITLNDQKLVTSPENRIPNALAAGVLAGFMVWGVLQVVGQRPDSSV